MNVCTGFILFIVFALTNSISQIKLKKKHRSKLEAGTDYTKEKYRDTKNLDSKHNFVAKFKDGNKNSKLVTTEPDVETFTDFIQETVEVLNTYEVPAFQQFFRILDTEIRKYHYDGCKFAELMQNRNTRTLLARALKLVRENTVTFTKANINEIADMMRTEMYDKNIKELLNYINSLYKNSGREFHIILNNMKLYTKIKSRDTHYNLEHVIRDGVQTILFNHYTKLDTRTRRELKEKIEIFWDKFKKGSASNDNRHSVIDTDPVSESATKTEIEDNIKEHERTSSGRKISLDKRKSIVGTDTFDEQFKVNKTEKEEPSEFDKRAGSTEETSSEEIEDTTVNTLQTKSGLQYKEEIEDEKRNANSNRIESSDRKPLNDLNSLNFAELINILKESEKQLDSASKTDNREREKYFNEYVQKKIKTIENEMTKLKQIQDLRNRLLHFDSDAGTARNITDTIELINKGNQRKYLKTDIIELLQNYFLLNDEIAYSDTMNTDFTAEPNTELRSAKRTYDAINTNDKPIPQVLRNNVNTTSIKSEDLNKKFKSNYITSTDSTANYTLTTRNSNRDKSIFNQSQIIRHKNPFDFVGSVVYDF